MPNLESPQSLPTQPSSTSTTPSSSFGSPQKTTKKHSSQKPQEEDTNTSFTTTTASNLGNYLMETLQSLRQQVQSAGQPNTGGSTSAEDITRRAQEKASQYREWVQRCFQNCASNMRDLANRYPPLAAVLIILVALSAVPVGTFAIFSLVSAAIIGTIAFIGFSIVEGTILAVGGGILLMVLSGIGLFTLVSFAFLSFVYISYRVATNVGHHLWTAGSNISNTLTGGSTSNYPSSGVGGTFGSFLSNIGGGQPQQQQAYNMPSGTPPTR